MIERSLDTVEVMPSLNRLRLPFLVGLKRQDATMLNYVTGCMPWPSNISSMPS